MTLVQTCGDGDGLGVAGLGAAARRRVDPVRRARLERVEAHNPLQVRLRLGHLRHRRSNLQNMTSRVFSCGAAQR